MLPRSVLLVVALLLVGAAPARAQGPALTVPPDKLAQALTCPAEFVHADHEPVLLVHGTATNTRDTWSFNYQKVLPQLGYDVCAVDLPDLSMGDIQVTSEYVVHAIREMHRRSGRRVDVVGHSQGTLQPRWAVRWWPDVNAATDDLVLLAGPGHGTNRADADCLDGCAAAIWQLRTSSQFIKSLNTGDETPGEPSVTSIYSESDELIQPSETAILAGASSVRLQALCAGRYVTHGTIVHDAVAFSYARVALDRPGPAPFDSVPVTACAQRVMPGVTEQEAAAGQERLYRNAAQVLFTYPGVPAEPTPAPYTRGVGAAGTVPNATQTGARGRLRLRVSPRRVRSGRRVRVRFLVTSGGRRVSRARVTLSGRVVRTNRFGRARITMRLHRPGRRVARATRTGMQSARAAVRVRRPRR